MRRWPTLSMRRVAGVLLVLDWASELAVEPAGLLVGLDATNRRHFCPAATTTAECSFVVMRSFGLLIPWRMILLQVPPRNAFGYMVLREAYWLASILAIVERERELSPATAAALLSHSAACFAVTFTQCVLHQEAGMRDVQWVPAWADLCPSRLVPARERLIARLRRLADRIGPLPVTHTVMSGIAVSKLALAHDTVSQVVGSILRSYAVMLAVSFSLEFAARGGDRSLAALVARMGADAGHRLAAELAALITDAPTDEDALQLAARFIRRRVAVGASVVALVTDATSLGAGAAALSLPRCVRASGEQAEDYEAEAEAQDTDGEDSSAAWVGAHDRALAADSRDFPAGLQTFADWRRAGVAGAEVAITVAVTSAASARLGTLQLRFGGGAQPPPGMGAELLRCCRTAGAALQGRRDARLAAAAHRVVSDIFPTHVARQLIRQNSNAADAFAAPRAFGSSREGARTASVKEEEEEEDAAPVAARTLSARGSRPQGRSSAVLLAQRRLAEAFSSVTVVFCDIVSFTPQCHGRSPAVVMAWLDALFVSYDARCDELGLYKVETIGDAYIAVAGMFPRRADHAAAALRFALAMHEVASRVSVEPGEPPTRLRVGVHTGPITAGLIGRTRAKYCLFGDTVNTASRMESTAEAGGVQCTAATLAATGVGDAIKDALERRRVDVKGLGMTDTYTVRAGTPAAATLLAALERSPSGRVGGGRGAAEWAAAADVDDGAPSRWAAVWNSGSGI